MTPLEEIKRGTDAQQLLENLVFKGALKAVQEGLVESMARSPMGDEKTHNRLVIALQLLKQIERQIQSVIETGQMARIKVDEGMLSRLRRA